MSCKTPLVKSSIYLRNLVVWTRKLRTVIATFKWRHFHKVLNSSILGKCVLNLVNEVVLDWVLVRVILFNTFSIHGNKFIDGFHGNPFYKDNKLLFRCMNGPLEMSHGLEEFFSELDGLRFFFRRWWLFESGEIRLEIHMYFYWFSMFLNIQWSDSHEIAHNNIAYECD